MKGVRMGCPLGSFGLSLALQAILSRRQRNNLHIVRITDESVLAARLSTYPPASSAELLRTYVEGMQYIKATPDIQLSI